MKNRRRLTVGALGAVAAMLATAAAAPPSRELALTIYNQDLALVRDRRAMDIARGTSEISFGDVAAQIDPTSVHFEPADGHGLRVLEQNYRYDLAGPDAVLSRYLDHPIEAVNKRGDLIHGTLLSQDGGSLVLRGTDGGEGVSIVTRAELERIDFSKLPEGLVTRPTLFWKVDSDAAGSREVEAEYLTSGMSWHAEYVAAVAPNSDALTLSAWVSIQNQSGAGYPDAKLKLIAGEVHRAETAPPPYMAKAGRAMAADMAAPFEEKAFFEYHLYTLDRPATVLDKEVKQLALFAPAQVQASRGYEYDGARNEKDVAVVIKFKNSSKEGLGIALPAGKVRVYQKDTDGSLEFVGEDSIDHTPRDEEVRVRVGNAFDIAAERAVTDVRRVTDRVEEQTIEVKLRNHKKEAVTVKVIEHQYGTWEVLEKTHEFHKKDAYTLEFEVPAPPDSEAVLRYRVRVSA